MGRLQEIKEDWLHEKETYQFRQLAIEPEDVEWLLEQAEKVERYEKECGETIDSRKEHKCPFNVIMTEEDRDKNLFEECKWCNGSGDDGGGYNACPDCESTGLKGGRYALEKMDEDIERRHTLHTLHTCNTF